MNTGPSHASPAIPPRLAYLAQLRAERAFQLTEWRWRDRNYIRWPGAAANDRGRG